MITPEGGGRPVAYTRCTTFVSAYEDTYNLTQWKVRTAAVGLSLRPDLALAVAAHRDDKDRLNHICQEALDAAQASAKATTGTALHALTEQLDRGQRPELIPADATRDLDAYQAATAEFKHIHIEQLLAYDRWKIAGTPDRVVEFMGKRYIADLKTGDIEWGAGKIAAQLAVYARSQVYDVATGERSVHGAAVDRGLVVHLPAGTGTCEVLWIDLLAGWEIVKTCREVRERRAIKAFDLYAPLHAPVPPVPLVDQIAACGSRAEVEELWRNHQHEWHSNLTAAASAHIASLAS